MSTFSKFILNSALAIALPAVSLAQHRAAPRPAQPSASASRRAAPSNNTPHGNPSKASTPRATASASNRGFTEHAIAGRPGFVSRTYVRGGRSYTGLYRMAAFHGVFYPHFVPAVFYAPGFYGWVLSPWPGPIVFSWGFYGAPWFGFYGPYFAPAPVYIAPELWLTDYVIAENLRAAYQAQAQASQAQLKQTDSITPEMKALIAKQIRQELEAERREAQSETADATPEALAPSQKIFVVSMNLNVSAEGGACSLSPGDMILRSSDKADDPQNISVTVVTSKAGSCPAGARTTLDLATLQEMHNDFRQQIDAGLATLSEQQGKGGLPKAPAADPKPSPDSSVQ